jgi:hypothetical protein
MTLAVSGAVLVLALLLAGAGALVARQSPRRASAPDDAVHVLLAGWLAITLLGIGCAIAELRLHLLPVALALAGAAGLWRCWRTRDTSLGWLIWSWVALFPLVALAAGLPPTLYDEFAQWLPNARFLAENDAFATAVRPNVFTDKPGYPPASTLIGYLAGFLVAGGHELAPKVFTVLLGGAAGLVLAAPFAPRISLWIGVPLGAALATVFNPFFDPRIALTAYTDLPTAFVLAVGVAAAWQAGERQATETPYPGDAARLATIGALLVLLRETNIVLVAALALALLALGRRGWRAAMVLGLAAAGATALWRVHLLIAGIPPRLTPRPLAEWDWTAPGTLLRVLFSERLANNPVLAIGAGLFILLVAGIGVWAMRRAMPPLRRLVTLVAILVTSWMAFVVWCYIALFTPQEIAGAGSFWRYATQVGPAMLYVLAVAVAALTGAGSAAVPMARGRHRLAVAACLAILPVFLLATLPHWRIDCRYPDIALMRPVAKAVASRIEGEPIILVNPGDPAAMGVALDYHLRRYNGATRPLIAPEPPRPGERFLLDLSGISRGLDRQRPVEAGGMLRRWDGRGWAAEMMLPPMRFSGCRASAE